MLFQYETGNLVLKILDKRFCGNVLDFYLEGDSYFGAMEPDRIDGFYTIDYHRRLLDYEEKLQLVSRFQAQKKAVQEMKHIMEGMEKKNPDASVVKAIAKMKKIADDILS